VVRCPACGEEWPSRAALYPHTRNDCPMCGGELLDKDDPNCGRVENKEFNAEYSCHLWEINRLAGISAPPDLTVQAAADRILYRIAERAKSIKSIRIGDVEVVGFEYSEMPLRQGSKFTIRFGIPIELRRTTDFSSWVRETFSEPIEYRIDDLFDKLDCSLSLSDVVPFGDSAIDAIFAVGVE
jgi:hypothetical protein